MTTPSALPLVYNTWATAVATLAVEDVQTVSGVVVGVSDAFSALLPQLLNYAELRIQRDLDFLSSVTSRPYALVTGNNQLALPATDFITVQTIQINNAGATFPLLPVAKEYLQNVWGTAASTAMPTVFAMSGGDLATGGNTFNNILVGPYPDANYAVTVFGTQRLPSLYENAVAGLADTATTFISQFLPDLLVQASLIPTAQYQRNFGNQSDNAPAMPGSYEAQYENLLKGAIVEEARRKFSASGWTSYSPAFVATPGR